MADPRTSPEPEADDPEEMLDLNLPVDIELPLEPGDPNGQPV